MSNSPKLEIEVFRIENGKYRIIRSDGEEYLVLKSSLPMEWPTEWIIERRSDCKIDVCKTLSGAKREILSGRYI
jgi:hypothetical protein